MTVIDTATSIKGASTSHSWAPNDLRLAPGMTTFLRSQDLGQLLPDDLQSPPGRNAVWIGRTDVGHHIFVKQLLGPSAVERIERQVTFDNLSEQWWPAEERPSPPVLGHDRDEGLIAYQAVDGRNGANIVVDEEFGVWHAQQAGALVGRLHNLPDAELDRLTTTPAAAFPPSAMLHAITGPQFEELSFGDVQMLQMLQHDVELRASVEQLQRRGERAPTALIHADFRIDQLIFAGNRSYLTDWEEWHLGDPARDVGAYVGECLYRAVLDVITTRGGQEAVPHALDHEHMIQRSVYNISRGLPLIQAFWKTYLSFERAKARVDDSFVERATGYAGWHTIDRLMANSQRSTRLRPIERAAAGIGRRALLEPHRYCTALTLEVPR